MGDIQYLLPLVQIMHHVIHSLHQEGLIANGLKLKVITWLVITIRRGLFIVKVASWMVLCPAGYQRLDGVRFGSPLLVLFGNVKLPVLFKLLN